MAGTGCLRLMRGSEQISQPCAGNHADQQPAARSADKQHQRQHQGHTGSNDRRIAEMPDSHKRSPVGNDNSAFLQADKG
ncbi:hypothetical protein D3C71_2016450 [compost metagenome]